MRNFRVFPLLFGTGTAVRLIIAWLPLEWQLGHNLCDDTFYYLTIARHAARTGMVSFDGLAGTNGFHPLWLMVISPLYFLPLDDIQAIHVIVTSCAVLDSLSMVMLSWILRALGLRSGTVILATAAYAFAPALVTYAGPMNGLETSLNILVLFTCIRLLVALERGDHRRWTTPAFLGCAAGLAFLSRTDNILVLAGVLLASVAAGNVPRVRGALIAAVTAFGVVLPWLCWNLWMFGTPLQVSGQAYSFPIREHLGVGAWGAGEYLLHASKNLADVFRFFPVKLASDTKHSFAYVVQAGSMLALVLVSAVIARRQPEAPRTRDFTRVFRLCVPMLGGALVFVVVHSFFSVNLRGWYYATLIPLLFPVTAAATDFVAARLPRRLGPAVGAMTGCAIVFLFAQNAALDRADRAGEREKYAAVGAMARSIPPGTRVGSWNAGVLGYFYHGGPVVNLDGLVNNVAFPYLRSRELGTYCARNDLRILVDMAGAFRYWEPSWGPRPGGLLSGMEVLAWVGPPGNDRSILIARIASPPQDDSPAGDLR
jgi:hypothetical protein